MTAPAERVLWTGTRGSARSACTLAHGCAGVELLLIQDDAIVRRERYPDASTAYERAQQLCRELESAGYTVQHPLS